jgi:2-succinyl-5-enolpyruvyl-6-hydroxy-3-cyclohexene-1-carboxylate synthase
MNITWSQQILVQLYRDGVRDLVFCSGARNSPLIAVLAKSTGFKLHSFFEERSAAFFALGVARRTRQPVAVLTTSGTAAAELLPAVIEAYHTGVPLILLTADRPRRLRGTGAPQAIDQTGLYAKFIESEYDLESGALFSLAEWTKRRPVHINICLDEPLLDRSVDHINLVESLDLDLKMNLGPGPDLNSNSNLPLNSNLNKPENLDLCALEQSSIDSCTSAPIGKHSCTSTDGSIDKCAAKLRDFLSIKDDVGSGGVRTNLISTVGANSGRPIVNGEAVSNGELVVIVGTLASQVERDAVAAFLVLLGCPLYLEATSGLRERSELQHLTLRSGDKLLSWALHRKLIQRILRIGGVPTVRIWRDLDEATCGVKVLSLSSLPFSGLSRGEFICADLKRILGHQIIAAMNDQNAPRFVGCSNSIAMSSDSSSSAASSSSNDSFSSSSGEGLSTLMRKDREISEKLQRLIESEPQSEPAMVHALSLLIPKSSLVYVGNSLSIREWDLVADYKSSEFAVEANRGVNGIDGQISTFLGLACSEHENWMLLGDLTTLYDLTGPWALNSIPEAKVRIVVMNNSGGKIFSRIFKNELFENRHNIGFEHWAHMWNLGYSKWHTVPPTVPQATSDMVAAEFVPAGGTLSTRTHAAPSVAHSSATPAVENLGGNKRRFKAEVIELIPDDEATQRFWDQYDALWI